MPFITYQGKNILFIHIPKTGGGTIEQWLLKAAPLNLFFEHGKLSHTLCSPQHLPAQDVFSLFHSGFFDYTFALVRNPYHRLESEYRWRLRHYSLSRDMPFHRWALSAIKEYLVSPFHLDNHMRPQSDFLAVDEAIEVFKLESGMQAVMRAVAKKTGLPLEDEYEDRVNDTGSLRCKQHWSPELYELVNEIYKNDFACFQYDMIDGRTADAPCG